MSAKLVKRIMVFAEVAPDKPVVEVICSAPGLSVAFTYKGSLTDKPTFQMNVHENGHSKVIEFLKEECTLPAIMRALMEMEFETEIGKRYQKYIIPLWFEDDNV